MDLPASPTPWSLLEQLKLPSGRSPAQSLNEVTVVSRVLQEFRPMAECLEWEIGRLAWRTDGVRAFASNAVPFVINNTGRTSEDAALVFFANCLERPPSDEPLRLLEIGAGTGLFARYFLHAFRAICEQEGQAFHHRLLYYVTDASRRTVEDWAARRQFEEFGVSVVTGTLDAAEPESLVGLDGQAVPLGVLSAVIANYALDVLPASVVRAGSSGPEQLCVRTHLTRSDELIRQYSPLGAGEIRALAASGDADARERLIALLPTLELEASFQPIDRPIPCLEDALTFGAGLDRIVLNHGAMQCVDRCLAQLDANGFVLINDYGPVTREQIAPLALAQRFGPTTAFGLNFPLFEHYYTNRGVRVSTPPGDEERQIHTRLLARAALPDTRQAFGMRFGAEASRWHGEPVHDAVRHATAGRAGEALDSFREALSRSPRDWQLIGRAAEFVALELGEHEAGLELIRAALELNPWYSTWLWNVLGDCLFCLGRHADAHAAYLQALQIDPEDVRTNFNLSYTFFESGQFGEALTALGRALARDAQGAYRDRALEKQRQILAALSARWLGEQERLTKRALVLGSPAPDTTGVAEAGPARAAAAGGSG